MKHSKLFYSTMALLMLASPVLAGINDGVVADYPFNGDMLDESGNGYDGQVPSYCNTPMLTEDRYGNPDSAFTFNQACIEIGPGGSLGLPSWGSYSVSAWFLNDGSNEGQGYGQKLIDQTTWYSDFSISVQNFTDGRLSFSTYTPYDGQGLVDPADYGDNQWHHVVVTKSGTHAELWIDGTLKDTTDDIKTVTNSQPLLLGYSVSGDGYQRKYWSGKIDDIRVYHRALAETEIVELFSGVAGSHSNLVLCNTLESEEAILNSNVGPGGTFSGGSFASDSGLFGRDAYLATNSEDNLVTFPKEVIPSNRGSIEFWAKLINFPASVGSPQANTPVFFEINDGMGARYEIQIQSNDGAGGGGLVSRIGNVRARTQGFGTVNYDNLLGGDRTAWHHYAASWDVNGLPLPGLGGTGTLEQWIDGVRVGNSFAGSANPTFPQPTSDVVKFIRNDLGGVNSVQMSNLKVWDFGKIHFFDRFVGCLPPAVADALADAGLDPAETPQEVLDALIAADEAGLLEVIPPGTTANDNLRLEDGAAVVLGMGSTVNASIKGPASSTVVIGDTGYVNGNIQGVGLSFLGGSAVEVNGLVNTDELLVGPGAQARVIGNGTIGVLEVQEGGLAFFDGKLTVSERLVLSVNTTLTVTGNLRCVDGIPVTVDPTATVAIGGRNQCSALQ